jgi:RNA-directed DNA polymerase
MGATDISPRSDIQRFSAALFFQVQSGVRTQYGSSCRGRLNTSGKRSGLGAPEAFGRHKLQLWGMSHHRARSEQPPTRVDGGAEEDVRTSPSKKSVQRLKTTVGNLLVPGNNAPWQEVRDTLNRSLRGWSNYFCYGTRRSAFRSVDRYTYERVRDFLARRHKVAGRGTRRFSYDTVYGELGLLRLERLPLAAASCALR